VQKLIITAAVACYGYQFLIISERFDRYKKLYLSLLQLELIPNLIEFIDISENKGIVINEYLFNKGSNYANERKSEVGKWLMDAITKLHDNGYVHSDLTEPNNIVIDYDNKKVMFIDIDDTFHISEINDMNIEDIWGRTSIDEMMKFEKKVCQSRFNK